MHEKKGWILCLNFEIIPLSPSLSKVFPYSSTKNLSEKIEKVPFSMFITFSTVFFPYMAFFFLFFTFFFPFSKLFYFSPALTGLF